MDGGRATRTNIDEPTAVVKQQQSYPPKFAFKFLSYN